MRSVSNIAVHCEGTLRVEAAAPQIAPIAKTTLRATAARTEQSLQRSVSFVSKEEKIARRSRASLTGDDLFQRVPTALTVHVLRRHGHAFSVLTEPGFEAELAGRFCEEVCEAYASAIKANSEGTRAAAADANGDEGSSACAGTGTAAAAAAAAAAPSSTPPPSPSSTTSSSLMPSSLLPWRRSRRESVDSAAAALAAREEGFAPKLAALLHDHAKPERLRRLRRLRQVDAQTREVANVMEETVDRMLATGTDLNDLEDKSEWLLAQATAFQRSARSTRRLMCCQNIKLTILLYGCCALVVAGGVVLVLKYTGILSGGGGGEPVPSPPPPNSSTIYFSL